MPALSALLPKSNRTVAVPVNILGISAFYHDSAACLVRDGEIIAAAQEERFTRVKHDAAFPTHAVRYCLDAAGLRTAAELDFVAFYEKPFLKFERLLSTYLAVAPSGLPSFLKAMPVWLKQKIWMRDLIREELAFEGPILFTGHHEAHASSAFFPSPLAEAAILTVDGVGEWTTTSIGRGADSKIELITELEFPHSLGLLYSAFTQYLGFRVNAGEYKVMGLAPYGRPKYRDRILDELIDLKSDGSFHLNLRYFNFLGGLTMTNSGFARLLGEPARTPESELTSRHADVARSIQDVAEEVMLRLAKRARELTGSSNLCLAGGVALNCVANARILDLGIFREVWVQPAAGDAGGALGAAMLVWHHYLQQPRKTLPGNEAQKASFLGPEYAAGSFAGLATVPHQRLGIEELLRVVTAKLAAGKTVGWFQGRMEFGPRALGNRSILADPRSPEMQQKLNLQIKFRESFRPFAPAVKRDRVADYFDFDRDSPYMLFVANVRSALPSKGSDDSLADGGLLDQLRTISSSIPAVTHVDKSARLQTVSPEDNFLFYRLLEEWERQTGCAVLVNTSFNVRGEPPVCTPDDAYRCFTATGLDCLVIGDCLFEKGGDVPQRANGASAAPVPAKPRGNNIDRSPAAVRRFGVVVGLVAAAVGALLTFRHHRTGAFVSAAGIILLLAGLVAPTAIAAPYLVWMKLSTLMGWVMTRVVLTVAFLIGVTPIAILQRLLGRQPMRLRLDPAAETYWNSVSAAVAEYEKQY